MGEPLDIVAAILGLRSTQTTKDFYAHLKDETVEAALRAAHAAPSPTGEMQDKKSSFQAIAIA